MIINTIVTKTNKQNNKTQNNSKKIIITIFDNFGSHFVLLLLEGIEIKTKLLKIFHGMSVSGM